MTTLSMGVVAQARKENEHRLPLHPLHFSKIPDELAHHIVFEAGYGLPFGISDAELGKRFGGVAPRASIMNDFDVVLLPKPLAEDLREMRKGGILWGWPHCVQQGEITQAAIDSELTLIAWEAMFHWQKNGVRDMHSFYRNNEMAGYCGVIHALGLHGSDGNYGPRAKALVVSLGSVSRGGIYALQGRGFSDITVYSQRPPEAVHDQVVGCRYGQMKRDGDRVMVAEEDGEARTLLEAMSEVDVIFNGIVQDTDRPLMYFREGEEQHLKPGCLIVDVSCDLRMGFPFARPTSFEAPSFEIGHATYYSVDHTPSYSWRSASWEISRVVTAFLPAVLGGPAAWEQNETIARAIEIRDGTVRNPKVLSFQSRAAEDPHALLG